ncbi:hypothetical protein DFJ77DRAFT_440040 [Powellomyces hirtus]|nr:hypothetical protein DFJ77DRAFT_440040 [Powellomyces hirtus]
MAVEKTSVLALYRQLLRTASRLPNPERRLTVTNLISSSFRSAQHSPPSPTLPPLENSAEWHFALGQTQLDNLMIQVEHLERLQKEEQLIIPVDIYNVEKKHWGRWAERGSRWGDRKGKWKPRGKGA